MIFQKLWLKNFRNFSEQLIEFGDTDHVVLSGENNQGKTNFLEAIYFLYYLKPVFGRDLKELVRIGEKNMKLAAEVKNSDRSRRIYVQLETEPKGLYCSKEYSEIFGHEPRTHDAFYLSADVLWLFQLGPEYRRAYMDRTFGSVNENYQKNNLIFKRVLSQRNHCLKHKKKDFLLDVINTQFVEISRKLVEMRMGYLKKIENRLKNLVRELFDWNLSLDYLLGQKKMIADEIDGYAEILKGQLTANLDRELVLGMTLQGPHRDDLKIELHGEALRRNFSRGIQRCIAIMLRVSDALVFQGEYNLTPLFLLDDTFSELDPKNQQKVITKISEYFSVVYCTTDQNKNLDFKKAVTRFKIKDGAVNLA